MRTLPIFLLLFASLANAQAPAPLTPGLTPAQVEKAWGAPDEKLGPTTWRYGHREGVESAYLDWQNGKLRRITLHYSLPKDPESVIPENLPLERMQVSVSPDFGGPSRNLAHPSTGRSWELAVEEQKTAQGLHETLKVITFTHGPAWKSKPGTPTLDRRRAVEALREGLSK